MRSSPQAPEISPAPSTRTDFVDERLRTAILAGELAPGTRLSVAELSRRFAVSPTPLREAFGRLAGEGLVELRPQRGAWVSSASVRDAEEVYELRILLEPQALRASLAASDATHRAEIRAAHEQYVEAIRGADLPAALDAHRAFHAALLSRCPNQRLLEHVDSLADHAQRFQVLAVGAPGGHHDVIAEHRTLCEEATSGTIDTAVEHLREHLQLTLDGVRGELE